MNKILEIIYYILSLFEKSRKKRKLKESEERREEVHKDPTGAFKDKFTAQEEEEDESNRT